jgi:hypothetical protein
MAVVIKNFRKPARLALRQFLEKHWSDMGQAAPQWLADAIEGLYALDNGEAQIIFTPRKTTAHGATPFTAEKYKVMAWAFYRLLRAKGYTSPKAYSMVCSAYGGVKDYTIKDWKKKHGHGFLLKSAMNIIAKCSDWSEDEVKVELNKAGKFFTSRASLPKKSVKLKNETSESNKLKG